MCTLEVGGSSRQGGLCPETHPNHEFPRASSKTHIMENAQASYIYEAIRKYKSNSNRSKTSKHEHEGPLLGDALCQCFASLQKTACRIDADGFGISWVSVTSCSDGLADLRIKWTACASSAYSTHWRPEHSEADGQGCHEGLLRRLTRSPSSALSHPFLVGRNPPKTNYRKKSWYPYSKLSTGGPS